MDFTHAGDYEGCGDGWKQSVKVVVEHTAWLRSDITGRSGYETTLFSRFRICQAIHTKLCMSRKHKRPRPGQD